MPNLPRYAKYAGIDLPEGFTYTLAAPDVRHNVTKTCGGVVIQSADEVVPGDSTIAWKVQAATRAELIRFLDWRRNDASPGEDFQGLWGDQYTVRFVRISQPRAYAGNLFDFEGTFQIVTVVSWGTTA